MLHTVMKSDSPRQNSTSPEKKGKPHDKRSKGNRDPCWGLFLVLGGRIRRFEGCRVGGIRIHGRKGREPDLRGRLFGKDRPRRGGPAHLRPERGVVQGNSGGVLRDSRPHDSQPPGQRRRDTVPLRGLLPLRRAESSGGTGYRELELGPDLRRPYRHRGRSRVTILRGRGLPSGIFPAEPRATLLRLRREAQSCEIPEALSGKTEEMTCIRMSAVQSGARGPGPAAAHS